MTVQKKYEDPTIEIVKLSNSDAIVTSPGDTDVPNPFNDPFEP